VGNEDDGLVKPETPRRPGPLAIVTIAIGALVLLFGFFGLIFIDPERTNPLNFFKWFGGGIIAHDGLVAPLVAVVALGIARFVPSRIKAPVQGALFASAVVVGTTFPFWRGYGRRPDDPSALPNDYVAGVLIVLGLIWITAALFMAVAWRRRRHSR
jgi:hypothetical protein